jgi:hypothetical protein
MAAKSPAIIIERPKLYPVQEAAIFAPERYSLIEASTKAGKTMGCLAWLFEQACQGREGWQYWWIAPWRPQAQMAYRRLKRKLPRELRTYNETELTLTLANGAVMRFVGGDNPDGLFGEDVHAAVIDEASRVREDSWHAVRSTLTATNGPIRMIGNVKGRRNWFYQLCRKAAAGEPGMTYHKLTWRDAVDAGVLEQAEIDDARRQLPEMVFRELYEAEASDDEGNPFGMEAIRANIGKISPRDAVVFGWDVAKSIDWTVGIGLDDARHVAHFSRFQEPWEETTERIYQETGRTPSLIDATGVGDPIVERLKRRRMQVEGFKFTAPSKQQLMEELALAIQHREVTYPDGPIVEELMAFEYEYTRTGVRYSAPSGMHDDCVCALALAIHYSPSAKRKAQSFAEVWSFDD